MNIITSIVCYLLGLWLRAWVGMVALGVAHSVDARVPALGLFAVWWLAFFWDALTTLRVSVQVEKVKAYR